MFTNVILILPVAIGNKIIKKDRYLIDHLSYKRKIYFKFLYHAYVKSLINLLINMTIFVFDPHGMI